MQERLLAANPNLAVLFMSGYTDDAVVRHGVLESETNFIQKPFTFAGLANAVRKVLDERGSRACPTWSTSALSGVAPPFGR